MKRKKWQCLVMAVLVLGGLFVMPARVAMAVTAAVSFQQGVNGYTGTFDRKIDDRGGVNDQNGSTVAGYFLDGYQGSPVSNDGQLLIRFDSIIGPNPGQIPVGATILSAEMTVNTNTTGNAQSNGPWGIAQMNGAFDGTTTYFGSYNCAGCAVTSRGPWWEDNNYTQRPLAGYGAKWQGDVATADITKIVQSWTSGTTNNGVVVQTGFIPASGTTPTVGTTTDGWGVISTGHPLVERRPKLSVTYTTDPIEVNTFQRGLNGYTGDTSAWVRSGTNIFGTTTPSEPDAGKDDITNDGFTGLPTVAANSTVVSPPTLTSFQEFLDGAQFNDTTGVAASTDDFGLFKFGSVFGNGAGQVPTDVPVAKAWLVLNTGVESPNAPSGGEWSVHKMLKPWTTGSLHSSFGAVPGLQGFDNDISASPLDTQIGIIYGSEVWFDVTSFAEGVRNGAADNGLAVLSTNTADGWEVYFAGATDAQYRPRLIVASGNASIVNPSLAGDFNGDGKVDGGDYVVWRDRLGTSDNLNGNGNESGGSAGTVDQADYVYWRANFGASNGGGGPQVAGVPEPATLLLVIGAAMAVSCGVRKRSMSDMK